MLADADIRNGFHALFDAIDPPPFQYDRIQAKIAQPSPPRRAFRWQRPVLVTAVATIIAILALPSATLAVFETIIVKGEQAIIRVIGWTPPPRPPASLESVRTHIASIESAQSEVHFTIVPPFGLPSDAKPAGIRLAPVLVYSNVTRKWTKEAPCVWFLYKRANGDTIQLLADVYDPRTGAPMRYMFLGDDLPGGRTKITKLEHFEWRNGDQVMSATAGEGLTAAEIVAVRAAMHGVAIPSVLPGQPDKATIVKRYRLPDQ